MTTVDTEQGRFITLDQLSDEQIGQVVHTVTTKWRDGLSARQAQEDDWRLMWRQYLMYKNPKLLKQQPWRTQTVVSWTYNMVEMITNEIMNLQFPRTTDWYNIEQVIPGENVQDVNAKLMRSYLDKVVEDAKFVDKYEMLLKQAVIMGSTVGKIHWKFRERFGYRTEFDENNRPVYIPEPEVTFDGPDMDVINMFDFVVHPLTGNIDDSTCIQRSFSPLDRVQSNSFLQNTEGLKPDTYSPNTMVDGIGHREINQQLGINDEFIHYDNSIELLEAWGDFVIDGVRYSNYVAVVARTDNKLLRFHPNPYSGGLKPFIFVQFTPVPHQIYGIGAVKPISDYQAMGTTIANMMFDEAKLKMHGQWKYVPDGVFDPSSFQARPGGAHAVADMSNLQAINPNINVGIGFQERNFIKGEMEQISGVGEFSKGSNVLSKTRTARESVLLSAAAGKRFTMIAQRFNRLAVLPAIKLIYTLVQQYDNPQRIMEYTGMTMPQLMDVLPLNNRQIKIIGLDNVLRQQEVLESLDRFLSTISNTPWALMLNGGPIVRKYLELLGFTDTENLLQPLPVQEMVQQMQLMATLGPAMGALGGPASAGQPSQAGPQGPQAPMSEFDQLGGSGLL